MSKTIFMCFSFRISREGALVVNELKSITNEIVLHCKRMYVASGIN